MEEKTELQKLRDEVLALVERRFEVLEADLRKSIADTFESHGQLLTTMSEGIADIRTMLMRSSGTQRAAKVATTKPDSPLARAVDGHKGLDLRDRARIVVYEAYETPTERMAALSTEQRAALDDGMKTLEAFIARGDSELSDDELAQHIARVAKLIRPAAAPATKAPKFMSMGKGKSRSARAHF